jgi:lipopolysaccharide/colanic/teichoic acid biosynthesis glycosyltransferase
MKRLFDVVVAAAGLLLLAPILAVVALLIRINLGGPVLFRQLRPGLDGAPFLLYKFRTMRDAVDATGTPLADEQRLTRLGHILRSSSLDELPELYNVLRGDMSLVGPRPLLMEYLPLYTAHQSRRHAVRPGITGWAQVNGRNAISWEQKFEYDVWYVDHQNFVLDLKILVLTVIQVFSRRGISHGEHATMPRFTGSIRDERGR